MLRICVLAVASGFPSTILHEIHDNFMLALDASERSRHSQPARGPQLRSTARGTKHVPTCSTLPNASATLVGSIQNGANTVL